MHYYLNKKKFKLFKKLEELTLNGHGRLINKKKRNKKRITNTTLPPRMKKIKTIIIILYIYTV